MWENFDGTETLCVAYERKNKPTQYTEDKSVLLNQADEITAEWNEKLTVSATLYKDNKTMKYVVIFHPFGLLFELVFTCCLGKSWQFTRPATKEGFSRSENYQRCL